MKGEVHYFSQLSGAICVRLLTTFQVIRKTPVPAPQSLQGSYFQVP